MKQVNMNLPVNRMAQALIAAGYMSDFVALVTREGGAPKPGAYVWFADDKSDAKLVLSALQTAYCAVIGAGLFEHDGTKTIFDESTDGTKPETTSELVDRISPEKPMSYAEAQQAAAVVFQVAVSLSRHPGNAWMSGFTVTDIAKDDAGLLYPEMRLVSPLRSFEEWITDGLAATPQDSNWFKSLVKARYYGLSVPHYVAKPLDKTGDGIESSFDTDADDTTQFHLEIHEAQARFLEWLNAIPWTREGLTQTRMERIVARCADNKWAEFASALKANDAKRMEKIAGEWTIIAHSPVMHSVIAACMQSATYQNHVLMQDLEQQSEQLARLEFFEEHARMRKQLQDTSALIKARMAKLSGEAKADVAEEKPAQSFMPKVIAGNATAGTGRR